MFKAIKHSFPWLWVLSWHSGGNVLRFVDTSAVFQLQEIKIYFWMWTNLLNFGSLTTAIFKAPPSMRSDEIQAHCVQDKAVLQAERGNSNLDCSETLWHR